MAVYVDKPKYFPPRDPEAIRAGRRHGQIWCHMWADSEGELIMMAIQIGMKRKWLQESRSGLIHFDLTPTRREKALELGAVALELRTWYRRNGMSFSGIKGKEYV